MTVDMLRAARGSTRRAGGEPERLAGRARRRCCGRDLIVEPDLSNAQPFLAAALVTGGRVTPGLAGAHHPAR